MVKNILLVSSNASTNYYTINDDSENSRIGISAQSKINSDNACTIESFFFTTEEANKCCEWLAQNEVDPLTLRDILADTYYPY